MNKRILIEGTISDVYDDKENDNIMATPLVIEKYSHPIVLLTVSDKLIMK